MVLESSGFKENKIKRLTSSIFAVKEIYLLLLLVSTIIILNFLTPYFFTVTNLNSLALSLALETPIVVGMAFLIISGGFDLSVGSVLALSGVVAGLLMPINIWLGILCGLLSGVVFGVCNGLLVTKVRINPLITTLGTMSVARGLAKGITEGVIVYDIPSPFEILASGKLFGIRYPIIIAIFLVIIGDLFLRRVKAGRQFYYVGGNEKAALFSGINVNKVKMVAFILCGIGASIAALMSVSRVMVASPLSGEGLQLKIIAAVVIGGGSLSGGEGSVIGAFMGFLFMAIMGNAMTLLNIPIFWQEVVIGMVLLIAVSIDMLTKKKRI